jgi:hypothetical protein
MTNLQGTGGTLLLLGSVQGTGVGPVGSDLQVVTGRQTHRDANVRLVVFSEPSFLVVCYSLGIFAPALANQRELKAMLAKVRTMHCSMTTCTDTVTCCSLTAAVHAGVILHSLHGTVCVVNGETLQATATTREEEARASDEEATDGDSEGGIARRRQSEEAAEVHRAHAEAVARESEGARRREEVANSRPRAAFPGVKS